MPLEEWEKVISVNLTGTFLCTREAARIMRADKAEGAIVMISSVHEVIPWEQFSHYCASKGGMKLFAQSIAKELAPHGIRVVSVAPGAIATPINEEVLDDSEGAAQGRGRDPAGPLGRGLRRRPRRRLGRLRPGPVRRRGHALRRRRDDALSQVRLIGTLRRWTTRA